MAGSAVIRPFLLDQDEGSVRRAQKAVRAGDHVEAVTGLHLPRVMHHKDRYVVRVAEGLQRGDVLIIHRVAIAVVPDLANLLKCVHDDEPRVRMLLHELIHLIRQAVS